MNLSERFDKQEEEVTACGEGADGAPCQVMAARRRRCWCKQSTKA